MAAVFFASVLSWYFGGVDMHLHPDRLIGSLVSYTEKSVYRKGTFREGIYALLINLAGVFGFTSLLLYFTDNAGSFWYFLFSVLIVYFCINIRMTGVSAAKSTSETYLSYSMPVIAYSFLLGPIGAVLYRTLVTMVYMLPADNERYRNFTRPASQTLMVLSDAANLLTPVLVFAVSAFRNGIRYLKSLLP